MAHTPKAEDGRKLRGEESRRKIVEALFEITRSGTMAPSAAQVAEKAGVGVRTVFRHFEEMDSLYSEMSEQTAARVLPIVRAPYAAGTWCGRLDELLERRFGIYEEVLPIKMAGDLYRFRSSFLMQDYQYYLQVERETFYEVLPARIAKNKKLAETLLMLASFQTWRQLRQDQNLSAQEAGDVVRTAIGGLIG